MTATEWRPRPRLGTGGRPGAAPGASPSGSATSPPSTTSTSTVPQGSFFALLGPSGCGKTTTLRMVAGLEEPTSGTILLGDSDISRLKPYKRPVNTVFQNYALFPHLTISENVAFGLRRRESRTSRSRSREMLELVELGRTPARRPPSSPAASSSGSRWPGR